ncbi:hypothetical protein A2U01_0103958, partial [Trifolium medium]|nr:hypothetical protein [Trifolium medium]
DDIVAYTKIDEAVENNLTREMKCCDQSTPQLEVGIGQTRLQEPMS